MIRKDNRLGRHIQTHCKGLGCEENLDETFAKENFDYFFENVEETGVVDADSSLEERENFLDLGEVTVVFGEGV